MGGLEVRWSYYTWVLSKKKKKISNLYHNQATTGSALFTTITIQNLGNFSDYERYLTWKVFFYSFTANNMRLLLMTLAPKIVLSFPIPRISLPGENYFEMEFCEEGKCLTTIGIQLGFFLVFKPLTSLLAYSKDDMWRGFKNKIRTLYVTLTCSSRSSSYSRTRRESIHPALIGRIDKEYRLYESDR